MNVKIIYYYKDRLVPRLDTAGVLTTMVLQSIITTFLPFDSGPQ